MTLLDIWISNPLFVGFTLLIFLLLDDFLTRLGFRLRQQGYNKYFISDIYEINPIFRKNIQENKPISVINFLLIVIVSILVGYLSLVQHPFTRIVIGGVFFILFNTIIIHIQNIHRLWFIEQHPETLRGKIKLEPKFTFMKSRSEDLGTGAFLFTIFILTGEIFILGGTLSFGLTVLVTFLWEKKDNRVNDLKES